jgi:hypothetical protein
MEMIGHEYEFVERVRAFFSVMQQTFDHSASRLVRLEQRATVAGLGRNEVRGTRECSMRQTTHGISSGAKALLLLAVMSELKLRPPTNLLRLWRFTRPAKASTSIHRSTYLSAGTD